MSKKRKARPETWKAEPEAHDFAAAASYLSLVWPETSARALADRLRSAPAASWKAKDLLRASALELLPASDPHVAGDLRKVESGERLSPVLLVRGSAVDRRALVIADGYHRICASCWIDEDSDVPCRMVDLA